MLWLDLSSYIIEDEIDNVLSADIDECQANALCDQICENTDGGFFCACLTGFELIDNRCQGLYCSSK